MNIKERLTQDMKEAMKAQEKFKLATVRLALAAIKQVEVDTRKILEEKDFIDILQKMLKQRKESIRQYEAAGRQDLADVEKAESDVLNTYLPTPLGDAEIRAMITAAIQETQASGIKDMGKVVGLLKPKLAGVADMGQVSQWVKESLGA